MGEHETIRAIRALPERIDALRRQMEALQASPPSDAGEVDRLAGRVSALKEDADDLLAREGRKPARLAELERTKQVMLARARQAEGLLQRVSWASVLHELTEALPGECRWLRCETDTVPADGAGGQDAPRATRLGIVGLSPTNVQVAAYVAALGTSSVFEDVRLVSVQDHRADGAVQKMFRIKLGVATGGDRPDRMAAR